ncbi:MAG: radical SAM family heme chaperone HemW [Tissierellaceae bacterium]|nr:radical SAM family heme chaperone HemW [Tissierellaceae bacterium]
MKDLSLYIHIPFCERKCNYCDFVSFPKQFKEAEYYINNLITELSIYKEELQDYKIKTIFIGGGTPSAIDAEYINRILDYIYNNYNTHDEMEISIELNPGTIDKEKLIIYKESGINRVSLGLQTLDNNILKKLGRIHSAEDFYESYKLLKEVGFENVNVDLIFDLPDQTVDMGMKDIKTLVDLGVKHISYYSLIIEPGTLMHKWYQENKLNLLDEDSERKLYHSVKEYLKDRGYIHYEISNFASNGYQCNHNMAYWMIKPYLGLGLSSHSNLCGKRFSNTSNLNEYIEKLSRGVLPVQEDESIDKETEIAEFCIFGLRLIKGIDKNQFKNRFNLDINDLYRDAIKKHKESGLLMEDDNFIRLSDKGLDLANLVEVDFLP